MRQRRMVGAVQYLPVELIEKSTMQPRRQFDEESLRELAASIAVCGILNPLTVRRKGSAYELVAGERRLRGAKLAGLREVPCILLNADLEEASLLALVENIQREDLNFWEEALAIQRMMRLFGLNQETAAKRLGKSQSAVANKLRILKLPEDILESLLRNHLTERHARALLRLPEAVLQREVLAEIISRDMTVAAAERLIDRILEERAQEQQRQRRTFLLKDVRLFLNSLTKNLELMKQGGIHADCSTRETDEALIVTVTIPKNRGESPETAARIG
ncbi:MAG: ParB/RepB/Spo0J family partition protein [Oscillospiraceae bacterium]|nr:ParB/RepB/Spo0J family partition protein [Oscillospiraceae bacterium]